jgi:ABC-type sugar transport system permease subunit
MRLPIVTLFISIFYTPFNCFNIIYILTQQQQQVNENLTALKNIKKYNIVKQVK